MITEQIAAKAARLALAEAWLVCDTDTVSCGQFNSPARCPERQDRGGYHQKSAEKRELSRSTGRQTAAARPLSRSQQCERPASCGPRPGGGPKWPRGSAPQSPERRPMYEVYERTTPTTNFSARAGVRRRATAGGFFLFSQISKNTSYTSYTPRSAPKAPVVWGLWLYEVSVRGVRGS